MAKPPASCNKHHVMAMPFGSALSGKELIRCDIASFKN